MTTSTGTFCKGVACPSSASLLAFLNHELPLEACRHIHFHLQACEFCEAELEFYRHYPPADETVAAGQIPAPLFELAGALLRNERDLSTLYGLIDRS